MRKPFIVKYLVTLTGLAALVSGIYMFSNTFDFLDRAISTQGTVVEIERSQSSDNKYTYRPIVEFETLNGQPVLFISAVGSNPSSYDRGEKVEVLYLESSPSEAKIDSLFSLWGMAVIWSGLGALFFFFGLLLPSWVEEDQKETEESQANSNAQESSSIDHSRYGLKDESFTDSESTETTQSTKARKTRNSTPPPITKPVKGLGGWLILVGFILLTTPFSLLIQLATSFVISIQDTSPVSLITPGSEAYQPILVGVLAIETLTTCVLLLLSLYAIYLFFSKHHKFPKIYISLLITTIAFIPLNAWLSSFTASNDVTLIDAAADFFGAGVSGLIWIPYLLLSKRVKNTFVEKRPNDQDNPDSYGATSRNYQ